eukprot:1696571-Pleurochrysis_carterae.AAC.3
MPLHLRPAEWKLGKPGISASRAVRSAAGEHWGTCWERTAGRRGGAQKHEKLRPHLGPARDMLQSFVDHLKFL